MKYLHGSFFIVIIVILYGCSSTGRSGEPGVVIKRDIYKQSSGEQQTEEIDGGWWRGSTYKYKYKGYNPYPNHQQTASVCATHIGNCPLMEPLSLGVPCFCMSQMGQIQGTTQ